MRESKAQRKRRLLGSDKRRVQTIREKRGPDWFRNNASKAGKSSPTKFNSETASVAAKKRWDDYRREKGN